MHQTAKMVVDGKSTPSRQALAWCELPCSMHHEAASIACCLPAVDGSLSCTLFNVPTQPKDPQRTRQNVGGGCAAVARERRHAHPHPYRKAQASFWQSLAMRLQVLTCPNVSVLPDPRSRSP